MTTDQERYARYQRLRGELGFTFEQVAADLGIGVDALRDTIARAATQSASGTARRSSYRARGVSADDRVNVRNASRHVAKAIGHLDALESHHEAMEKHIRAARDAHQKVIKALPQTLEELGERAARRSALEGLLARAMDKLGTALDGLKKFHGEADDAAGSAQDCVRAAEERLNAVANSGNN